MRDQFLGLRKKPIDALIKKMDSEFFVEKARLVHDLESISIEKVNLLAELKELNEKQQAIPNEQEFWELGNIRLASVINRLNVQKNLELSTNKDSFDEQMSPITEQILDLDFKIKASERLLDKLFTKVDSLVEQSQSDLLNPPLEEKGLGEPIQDESMDSELDNNVENTVKSPKNENAPLKSDTDSFWGNLGDWIVDALQADQNPVSSGFGNDLKETESKEVAQIAEGSEGASESKKSDIEAPNANHDHVLIEQIDTIKTNYIVGKLAGDDLLDQSGHLIVSKYSLITKEVVDKANQAGKLADLIVNMKLSGPGVG